MKFRTAHFAPACAGVLLLVARALPVPHDGALLGLPALCPFRALTGIPCPGCGLTRALVLCAHGDWAQAISFHPLGPLFYVSLWCVLIGGVLAVRRDTKPAARVLTPRAAYVFGGIFCLSMILVWVLRLTNIVPFPQKF